MNSGSLAWPEVRSLEVIKPMSMYQFGLRNEYHADGMMCEVHNIDFYSLFLYSNNRSCGATRTDDSCWEIIEYLCMNRGTGGNHEGAGHSSNF